VTPERWLQIEGLFHAACERAPAERGAFLAEACGDDAAEPPVLRQAAALRPQSVAAFYQEYLNVLRSLNIDAKINPKPVEVADPIPLMEPAEGLEVVPFEDKYEKALYHAHMEAFLDHWGFQTRPQEEWRKRFDSADFRPQQSFLVLTPGREIAGYLLSMAFADPSRMTMATIGTRRPWRRKGVATALMAAALGAYREAGVTTANLGVDTANPSGAVGVYERMGFRAMHKAVTFSRLIGD